MIIVCHYFPFNWAYSRNKWAFLLKMFVHDWGRVMTNHRGAILGNRSKKFVKQCCRRICQSVVMHGQCDARPTVMFVASERHLPSRPLVPSYTAWWQRHVCQEWLAQCCTRQCGGWDSNPPPLNHEFNASPSGEKIGENGKKSGEGVVMGCRGICNVGGKTCILPAIIG